jgi:hypothetical protein
MPGRSVQGEQEMQKEIYARGPIACSLYAHSSAFEQYHGGVIKDDTVTPAMGTTHVVAIVGWGTTSNGQPYWIGRNSFGSIWGEGLGFFRLERGTNQLNLETSKCAWVSDVFTRLVPVARLTRLLRVARSDVLFLGFRLLTWGLVTRCAAPCCCCRP